MYEKGYFVTFVLEFNAENSFPVLSFFQHLVPDICFGHCVEGSETGILRRWCMVVPWCYFGFVIQHIFFRRQPVKIVVYLFTFPIEKTGVNEIHGRELHLGQFKYLPG